MGSQDPLPWCAARRCPATEEQGGCGGYILANHLNQTAQNFVACCKIQCGRSANVGLLGSRCGGATTATSIITYVYLLLLLAAGGYMVTFGLLRRTKTFTSWIILIGSAIFTTGTGVFVIDVTSPFVVLQTVPAVGAMNVAIFSYFFCGFNYGVAVGYESAPLFAFIATAWTIGRELNGLRPADGFIRTGDDLAIAMLVFSFTWIVHSISYRLFGYRVDWNKGCKRRLETIHQDPRVHMGAAQGHPTWRTPMGQSTSVIMTSLAWSMVRVVHKDFKLIQKCRPDWVFQTMLLGAPILITFTLVWNILSGMRCREVEVLTVKYEGWSIFRFFRRSRNGSDYVPSLTTSQYPGLQSYIDFIKPMRSFECRDHIKEYANAVALQRMQRNTMLAETVPVGRLLLSDQVIGFTAWFLALVGLMISLPGFCSVWLVAELFGIGVELCVHCFPRCKNWMSWLVRTKVTNKDRLSAAKVLEICSVGDKLSDGEVVDWKPIFKRLENPENHRSVNLNTFLDSTGPAELYNLLKQQDMRSPS